MKSPFLYTKRLFLSELDLDDAPFILELTNTDGWLKYIGDKGIRSKEDACSYLTEGPIKSYQTNGYGLWGFGMKKSSELMGMCGLINRMAHPDLGFAILPEFGGQGHTFEAASCVLEYARDKLTFERVYAITQKQNVASQQLLGKLGFEHLDQYMMGGEELDRFHIKWSK